MQVTFRSEHNWDDRFLELENGEIVEDSRARRPGDVGNPYFVPGIPNCWSAWERILECVDQSSYRSFNRRDRDDWYGDTDICQIVRGELSQEGDDAMQHMKAIAALIPQGESILEEMYSHFKWLTDHGFTRGALDHYAAAETDILTGRWTRLYRSGRMYNREGRQEYDDRGFIVEQPDNEVAAQYRERLTTVR